MKYKINRAKLRMDNLQKTILTILTILYYKRNVGIYITQCPTLFCLNCLNSYIHYMMMYIMSMAGLYIRAAAELELLAFIVTKVGPCCKCNIVMFIIVKRLPLTQPNRGMFLLPIIL